MAIINAKISEVRNFQLDEASNNINDLETLSKKILEILAQHGNMPLAVSVLQEEPTNSFGTHFEDRSLSADLAIVQQTNGDKFLELYV